MPTRTYSYEFDVIDKVTAPVKKFAGAFRNTLKPVRKLKSVIRSVKQPIRKVRRSTVRFGKKFSQIFRQSRKSVSELKRSVILFEKRLLRVPRKIGNAFGKIKKKLGGLATTVLGFLAFDQIRDFGAAVIDTVSRFERMKAVLTNLFGNEGAANIVFKDISKFASVTPFQVDQLTDSWVKLANQGFTPNMKQMTNLGDLASSTGKEFDQLAEAVIDAQVGEFERLKEFGVRAKKSGDKVQFTFKGVTKEVGFTAGAIRDYILGLGKMQGVQGSMNAISKTTGGQLSNLTDKWTSYKNFLGTQLKPVISEVIGFFSRTIDRLTVATTWVSNNASAIKFWAGEGLKLITIITSMWAAARFFVGYQAMVTGITVAYTLLTSGIGFAKIAMMAFNFIASLNPFGWIGLVIGGIVAIATNFGGVRDFLVKVGKFLWDHHPFKWLENLITVLFPSFGKHVKSFFNGIWDFIIRKFIKPIKEFFAWLKGESIQDFRSAEGDYQTSIYRDAEKDYTASQNSSSEINPYTMLNTGGGFKPTRVGAGKGSSSNNPVKDGLSGVRGGGNIKHINIRIDKLVEQLTISTSTIGMAKEQLKAEIGKILLSVVNDVNYQ